MRAPVLPAFIFVLVIIILLAKIIIPAIFICGIIALIIYTIRVVIREHQEKIEEKRQVQDKIIKEQQEKIEEERQAQDEINSLMRVIEDTETRYYNLLDQASKLGSERIFLLSYAEKLFIRIQIDKTKLALLDDSQNIEKLDHVQLQMRIDELQDDLSKYRKIDTYKMNGQMAKCYKDLTDILQEINKTAFYVGENQYKFATNVYNSVFPENAHVYSLITKAGSIYFYPQYIVIANSETDFSIIQWEAVSVSTITENRYSSHYLTNGEMISSRFVYSCKDGSPDRRYKDNPVYYTYRYGIVKIRKFAIAIPNSKLAIRLNDIILRIKSIHNE